MLDIKIKKILVPFDFSAESINALEAAAALATRMGAEISLLYAVTPLIVSSREYAMPGFSPFGYLEEYILDLKKGLHDFIFKNKGNLDNISSCKVELGYWNNVVTEEALKQNFDLIIVGKPRIKIWENFGNNLSPLEIIKTSKIPVITVTKHFSKLNYRNLILPIRNVDNWFDKVPFIVSIAKQTGAVLHIIGLDEKGDYNVRTFIHNNIDYIISIFEENEIRYTITSSHNEPILKTLGDYSTRKRGDIVALTPDTTFNLSCFLKPRFFNRFLSVAPSPVMRVNLG